MYVSNDVDDHYQSISYLCPQVLTTLASLSQPSFFLLHLSLQISLPVHTEYFIACIVNTQCMLNQLVEIIISKFLPVHYRGTSCCFFVMQPSLRRSLSGFFISPSCVCVCVCVRMRVRVCEGGRVEYKLSCMHMCKVLCVCMHCVWGIQYMQTVHMQAVI